jgi:hypothetical protein
MAPEEGEQYARFAEGAAKNLKFGSGPKWCFGAPLPHRYAQKGRTGSLRLLTSVEPINHCIRNGCQALPRITSKRLHQMQ